MAYLCWASVQCGVAAAAAYQRRENKRKQQRSECENQANKGGEAAKIKRII